MIVMAVEGASGKGFVMAVDGESGKGLEYHDVIALWRHAIGLGRYQ